MSHDTVWIGVCERHGWDGEPADHWRDMDEHEQRLLSGTWHDQYDTGEPFSEQDTRW